MIVLYVIFGLCVYAFLGYSTMLVAYRIADGEWPKSPDDINPILDDEGWPIIIAFLWPVAVVIATIAFLLERFLKSLILIFNFIWFGKKVFKKEKN